ncbi:MAG: hypothetical protein R2730_16785 [Chitinophagales bacterium]
MKKLLQLIAILSIPLLSFGRAEKLNTIEVFAQITTAIDIPLTSMDDSSNLRFTTTNDINDDTFTNEFIEQKEQVVNNTHKIITTQSPIYRSSDTLLQVKLTSNEKAVFKLLHPTYGDSLSSLELMVLYVLNHNHLNAQSSDVDMMLSFSLFNKDSGLQINNTVLAYLQKAYSALWAYWSLASTQCGEHSERVAMLAKMGYELQGRSAPEMRTTSWPAHQTFSYFDRQLLKWVSIDADPSTFSVIKGDGYGGYASDDEIVANPSLLFDSKTVLAENLIVKTQISIEQALQEDFVFWQDNADRVKQDHFVLRHNKPVWLKDDRVVEFILSPGIEIVFEQELEDKHLWFPTRNDLGLNPELIQTCDNAFANGEISTQIYCIDSLASIVGVSSETIWETLKTPKDGALHFGEAPRNIIRPLIGGEYITVYVQPGNYPFGSWHIPLALRSIEYNDNIGFHPSFNDQPLSGSVFNQIYLPGNSAPQDLSVTDSIIQEGWSLFVPSELGVVKLTFYFNYALFDLVGSQKIDVSDGEIFINQQLTNNLTQFPIPDKRKYSVVTQ